MNIEEGLIAAIVRHGMTEFYRWRVDPGIFSPHTRQLLEWMNQKFLQGVQIDFPLVKQFTGVDFSGEVDRPILFWLSYAKRKHIVGTIKADSSDFLTNSNDEMNFDENFNKFLVSMSECQGILEGSSLAGMFNSVQWDLDVRYYNNLHGIKTAVPALNNRLGGWYPEDLIVMTARPSVGKTWFLLLNTNAAFNAGAKVLLVTTEMSEAKMRMRALALASKVPYWRQKSGLTTMDIQVANAYMDSVKHRASDYQIMDVSFDSTVEAVEAKIAIHKPQLVAIDGAYLLKSAQSKERDRLKRIAEIFDRYKALAKKHRIPVIVTSQVNRGEGQLDLGRLAFSDNVGMVADVVLILDRDEVDKEINTLKIIPAKLRESDNTSPIYLNWDFNNYDFHEKDPVLIEQIKAKAEEEKKKNRSSHKPGSLNSWFSTGKKKKDDGE